MNHRRRNRSIGVAAAAVAVLLLAASCGSDDDEPAAQDAAARIYETVHFVVPFDVDVPPAFDPGPTIDAANFVTWDAPKDEDPALRFLVPVEVFTPGEALATAPPEDYLAYLDSLQDEGATLSDREERTIDGRPATLVTATTTEALDGSLGCQIAGLGAGDCFGLQPDLTLRIAVVEVDDQTLVAWLRLPPSGDSDAQDRAVDEFEAMFDTFVFVDREPEADDEAAAVGPTPLDGAWTTSITEEQLSSSPLLLDADEVNDENWGELTLTFAEGRFVLDQVNPRGSSHYEGTFSVEGDVLALSLENLEEFRMRWSVEGDRLVLERDDGLGISPTPYVLAPWTRQG